MLQAQGADAVAAILDGDAPPAPHPLSGGGSPEWDGAADDFDPATGGADADALDDDLIIKCSIEPLNDTGNGARLLTYFGDDLLHVRNVGWHAWIGTRWLAEGGEEIVSRSAQQTAARIALEADFLSATPSERLAIEAADDAIPLFDQLEKKGELSDAEKAEKRRLSVIIQNGEIAGDALKGRKVKRRAFAVTSGNTGRIVGMIAQAVPHRTVKPDALDRDALKFNCENGTLVFEASQEVDMDCPDPDETRYIERWHARLQPHDRGDMITKIAPVAFNPKAECPRFMAFLDLFQPNMAVRNFLQAYHGYALTGLTGEQCLEFNYGLGANGKSTFIDIVARIMGDYALTLAFESLAGESGKRGDQATPDIARLPGARLVRASEPERGVHFKESLLKSLTGGEPMLARHLHKGFIEFLPEFKLVLSANTKPEIGGVDHGIWRRMRLVPWEVTIPEADRRPIEEVMAELWEERSGILNWLVAGAERYLAEGLIVPQEIVDATAEYREDMDPVGAFVLDCVTKVAAPPPNEEPQKVSARVMYDAFSAWAHHNSVRPWREKAFATAMSQKGFAKVRERQGRYYLDVLLHDVPSVAKGDNRPPHPADDDSMNDVVPV